MSPLRMEEAFSISSSSASCRRSAGLLAFSSASESCSKSVDKSIGILEAPRRMGNWGEECRMLGRSAICPSLVTSAGACQIADLGSERPDHHHDHDDDQRQQSAPRSSAGRCARRRGCCPRAKSLRRRAEPVVEPGQRQHRRELDVDPAVAAPVDHARRRASSSPKIQVAIIAGFMIARSSRGSITLKVSDSSDPGAAPLGVVDEEPRQVEQPRHPARPSRRCAAPWSRDRRRSRNVEHALCSRRWSMSAPLAWPAGRASRRLPSFIR